MDYSKGPPCQGHQWMYGCRGAPACIVRIKCRGPAIINAGVFNGKISPYGQWYALSARSETNRARDGTEIHTRDGTVFRIRDGTVFRTRDGTCPKIRETKKCRTGIKTGMEEVCTEESTKLNVEC